jgi:hypothetical protein
LQHEQESARAPQIDKDEVADKDKTIERLKSLIKRVAGDLVEHKGYQGQKVLNSIEMVRKSGIEWRLY